MTGAHAEEESSFIELPLFSSAYRPGFSTYPEGRTFKQFEEAEKTADSILKKIGASSR
jgi:hypothetical protein